jgi:hypothetical protein
MKLRKNQSDSAFVKKILAIGLFCLLFLPLGAFGKTLAEYRAGVKSAAEYTRELLDYVDEGEKDAAYESEVLAEIRKALPLTERVEWEGSLVETSNHWLEEKLKAFEESGDWAQRRSILREIGERLSAVEAKINQLEAPAVSDRSKDEDKRKLAEILRRVEYQKPDEQQESWFQRLQRKISEWFDEKFPRPNVPAGANRGFQTVSLGLQILLYAVVLGFIAFLIYRFAPLFADRFKRREREDEGERVILGERLAADEDARTLFDEAETLAREGNLRGAIRKGYIALLCELSDRRIIGLAQHKTNRDYLRDVRRKGALYENMNGLTASFERHWYGFETADEADWQEFKQTYQRAVSDVNSKFKIQN